MAAMESSGQARAIALMNAARRSHFVSRIEKYEAKVRQAKTQMREQKESLTKVERRRPFSDTDGQLVPEENEHKAASVNQPGMTMSEEGQQGLLPEQRVTAPPRKCLLQSQAPVGTLHTSDMSHDITRNPRESDLSYERVHERDYSPLQGVARKHHETGFLSHDENIYHHSRSSSSDRKAHTEQKEMITSRSLSRSTSSNMESVMKAMSTLNMVASNSPATANVLSDSLVPSEAHANIYFDFKPPTPEVNLAAIAGTLNVRIKAADMSVSMQAHAFRCARGCLATVGKMQSKRIAYTLKKTYPWCCKVQNTVRLNSMDIEYILAKSAHVMAKACIMSLLYGPHDTHGTLV
ncbi:hypothetical protein KP509_30G037700 [Ceratopteris richardii]|uniref:Uncharacterized protein n=1 Tax=Ceratopteris richardii TaxID=49495 RepID=A0A8T2R373_CERRI|nr:hypothetical protein KP509_30G037700 [Ceratopteris richardii]